MEKNAVVTLLRKSSGDLQASVALSKTCPPISQWFSSHEIEFNARFIETKAEELEMSPSVADYAPSLPKERLDRALRDIDKNIKNIQSGFWIKKYPGADEAVFIGSNKGSFENESQKELARQMIPLLESAKSGLEQAGACMISPAAEPLPHAHKVMANGKATALSI